MARAAFSVSHCSVLCSPGTQDEQTSRTCGAGVGQRSDQLREAKIVAGHETELHSPLFEDHRLSGGARLDECGLPEALRVEKVDLPVESQPAPR